MRPASSRILVVCCAFASAAPALADPAWVVRSNEIAQPVLQFMGRDSPQVGSGQGLEEFDTQVDDFKPGYVERREADATQTLALLKQALATETDPKVREDIEIMQGWVADKLRTSQLTHDLLLSYVDVGALCYGGAHRLLDPRNSPERRARAVELLKRYAGIGEGYQPLTSLVEARVNERLLAAGLTGPYRVQVEQSLKNIPRYLNGLSQEFQAAKLTGWEEAHQALAVQLKEYGEWVEKTLVPRCRETNVLPEAIYEDNLKRYGVRISPEELIERGRFGYLETRDEMQRIASQIAADQHLPSSDYRDVMREVRKKQLVGPAILPFYQARLKQIEDIIREHDLITLPERSAKIRLASEAESATTPIPHMDPPRLIGNHGEYGEFVLPTSNPNVAKGEVMDDFTNEAASWTLTSHEARPGHELQFSAMVEGGVSEARAIFAFNSANVEGWGLYCEALMTQYFPPDGQLFALQGRLQREARAFLDPMLNLGQITPAEAKAFLMREVCESSPMAQQEVDRYSFRSPGQATSYYYGYMKLREVRAFTEFRLGTKFNQKAFHDFVLSQGLLPPDLLTKAIEEEFVPKYVEPTIAPK